MKTKSVLQVVGYYDRWGYSVYVNGVPRYSAGNSPHDSTQIVPATWALPLRKLRSFCIKTAKEIADEVHGRFVGVERRDYL